MFSPKRKSDDVGSISHRLATSSFRSGFKQSLLSVETEIVAFAIKEKDLWQCLTISCGQMRTQVRSGISNTCWQFAELLKLQN